MAEFGLSQALGLIAGSPLSKAGTVIAEKLPVTKSMGLGGIGGLLSKVLQDGNLSSIMQNPAAAIAGQVQAQVQGAVSQLSASIGGGAAGLVNALSGAGGLSSAIGALKAAGDALSGLGASPQGFFDLVAHGNMIGALGADAPAAMSYGRAAGPVTSGPALAEAGALVDDTVRQVLAGSMPADAAAAIIQQRADMLRAIAADSADALARGQAAAPLLGIASAIGGALAVPSSMKPTPIQDVLATLVQPQARAAMDAAAQASLGAGAAAHDGVRSPMPLLSALLKKIRGAS